MSRRDAPAAVAEPEADGPDHPTLEEFLRPLRDRYRFLEDYFNLQAEAVFASCPADMSSDGLFGLNEICREGGDLIDDLLEQLPRHVVNLRVRNVQELGPQPGRSAGASLDRGGRLRTGSERAAAAGADDDEDDED